MTSAQRQLVKRLLVRAGLWYDVSAHARAVAELAGPADLLAIDVGGANDLQPHWHRLKQCTDFMVFEPHDGSYQALVRRAENDESYRRFTYLPIALAEQSGEGTLHVTNVPTGSGIVPLRPDSLINYPENSYLYPMQRVAIQTRSLASVLDEHQVPRVHAIKLDVQGGEIPILRGLDSTRRRSLLAVELECPAIDVYEGGSTVPEALSLMRESGLEWFGVLTARMPGTILRDGPDEIERFFGCPPDSPSVAQRIWEFDLVFFREPRHLMASNPDALEVRRLSALLAAYGFLGEALWLIRQASKLGVLDAAATSSMLDALRVCQKSGAREVRGFERQLRRRGWTNWAHWMYVRWPAS